ncbi:hypothetical protein ACFB49_30920 [Sphingomonas sp. DBB INV C78]|uniref:hypothetical protein n=1 Tax=Sphingomonas sp. DBB INV C78 TaxID=3349434 RepID=UPI0036D423F1
MSNQLIDSDILTCLGSRRGAFEEAMAGFLAEQGSSAPGSEDRAAARLLFDLVIASLGGAAFPPSKGGTIQQRYLSRFGDGLVPVLKDVFGSDQPITFLAHCVDGYWRGVRDELARD